MKIKKVSNKKPVVLAAVIVGLLLVAGSIAYATGIFAPKEQNTVNYDAATEEEKAAGEAKKNETIRQDNPSKDGDSTGAPANNSSDNVTMRITAASQAAGTVSIRTIIDSVTSSGSCNLSMKSSSGASYTATASVQALASSSTCTGFDIPVSELSPGEWTIEVMYKNGDVSGTATGAITVT